MKTRSLRLRSALCLLLCIVMLLSSGSVSFSAIAAQSVAASASSLHKISTKCRTSDGSTYKVSVSFGDDAGIPRDARLDVREISESDARYDGYVDKMQSVLRTDGTEFSYTRILDISIVDRKDPERIWQPSLGATVDVRIRMSDFDELPGEDVSVVHFAGRLETPKVVRGVDVEKDDVCFETDGFSAYAIVSGPSADGIISEWEQVSSVNRLRALADEGVYVGHTDGFFFTNQQFRINSSRTGITKTTPKQPTPPETADLYYFEFVDGSSNQFRAYCYSDDMEKQYVKQNGNSLSFVGQSQATVFTIEPFINNSTHQPVPNAFQIKGDNDYCWNMQGGTSGKSFAAYNANMDTNAKIGFWHYTFEITSDDVYGLDGRTVGLMNYTGHTMGKALMAQEVDGGGALEAMGLVVLEKENNRDDVVFVSNAADITEWTFDWAEDDLYYLTANVNGSLRYLQLTSEGPALVSVPDDNCKLRVIPGTGTHEGQICLQTSSDATLTYSGNVATGFSVGGTVGSEWLNFVEMTDLTPDYLMTYSARKVSVSDPSITNGSHVILYTRVWNNSTKRYEFYAVDHDGSLVPCYESGDSIRWVGNRINTLLWNFVEYYWEGTNDPNYYYELYNPYSEQFIAPQVSDGQILSDNTIGINLNGRRNGYYYTPIVAWDDANYSYVGLNVVDDHIASCPLNQTDDFYFAIIQDLVPDDSLTTVPTVDNNQHGITMKLIDFTAKVNNSNNNPNEQDIILGSSVGGAVTTTVNGLLSTDLDENGYPTAVNTGRPFSELFDPTKEVDANHLFIQSIYNATGYFEYDSTQNFASLQSNGNFNVYEELGSMDTGDRATLKHGQFMPFNDIEAGYFSSLNPKNLYNALAQELPNGDPRKGEHMYLVRNPDYYFGMELEASFVQTPNGHDAWGHDIIYEFTGDDDFWLYVDGELVIDLGGIHSALAGTVNFCTGDVMVNGRHTTLYSLFYNNYLNRTDPETGVKHTAAEAQAYVDEIFEQNARGEYVFKSYTTHTMRIFYMERGAGASNLHMRFNLASVRPGTVLLSKELGNVDEPESVLAEYPYQIWYKKAEDDSDYLLTEDDLNIKVYYKDTITPVKYKPTMSIDGVTYNSVFILKPTEVAEIDLPDDAISYRIVECGINTDVYSSVEVNGTEVEGTEITGHDNREDYGIEYASAKSRPRVTYRNNVDPAALRNLTIRKVLYDETGENELHFDSAIFNFRLYLGPEYSDGLDVANMQSYHVKNEDGVYCVWNAQNQQFEPLGAGKTDYTQFTAQERARTTFTTSMNGSISKIPPFYVVEVREILADTQYKVEERGYEIPDGYSLQKYVFYPEGLNATGTDLDDPVQDTIVANQDPHVDVCNLKGWGLRVNKLWSDADYMSQRGPTYFAVYTGADEAHLTLVPGTVRQLAQGQNSLYWYFQRLPVAVPFNQYEIREVALTNPSQPDADGYVASYDSITLIPHEGTATVSGTQIGESTPSDFEYTVLYDKGQIENDSNVRVDTTTNNRPGIVLKKAQWNGTTPLAGAQFTLSDENDTLIGTFTSDADGLITIAFLRDDVDYTLSEIVTPSGFYGLPDDVTIRLSNGTVTVSGVGQEYYVLTQGAGITPTLVLKNRSRTFEVIKKDADSDLPLAGVRFALHRQVTIGGVTTIDFNPMPGYANLVTDANGVIPRLDNTLAPGTYELRESAAPNGYQPLPSHIRFTVGSTGEITLLQHPDGVTLDGTVNAQTNVMEYVLTVPNSQRVKVSVWKTNTEHTAITTGATFKLYHAEDFNDLTQTPNPNAPVVVTGTTDENGILYLGSLALGEYRLVETQAPEGYSLPFAAVRITVAANSVTAIQGGRVSEVVQQGDPDGYWVAGQDADTWQIRVWNMTGIPMPFIGGAGTRALTLCGGALLVMAAFILVYRRRRRFAAEY